MVEFLRGLADFLREYGAYAGTALTILFFMKESRAHAKTREEYTKYLKSVPRELIAHGKEVTVSIERLERAFLKHGIDVEEVE